MKYMAIIDADEKPVSCEFIGCNGNVAPYLIGATTNIKALEQEPVFDKAKAEIEQKAFSTEIFDEELFNSTYTESVSRETAECESIIETEVVKLRDVLAVLCKYKAEAEWLQELKQLREQTRWIPVSERLPKPFSFVNCTCHSLIDDREDWVVETCYLPQLPNSPYSDWGNIPMLNHGDCEVVAWMYREIPEPYKAESEEK